MFKPGDRVVHKIYGPAKVVDPTTHEDRSWIVDDKTGYTRSTYNTELEKETKMQKFTKEQVEAIKKVHTEGLYAFLDENSEPRPRPKKPIWAQNPMYADTSVESLQNLADRLLHGFEWIKTAQGHTYWNKVHDNLLELINELKASQ